MELGLWKHKWVLSKGSGGHGIDRTKDGGTSCCGLNCIIVPEQGSLNPWDFLSGPHWNTHQFMLAAWLWQGWRVGMGMVARGANQVIRRLELSANFSLWGSKKDLALVKWSKANDLIKFSYLMKLHKQQDSDTGEDAGRWVGPQRRPEAFQHHPPVPHPSSLPFGRFWPARFVIKLWSTFLSSERQR